MPGNITTLLGDRMGNTGCKVKLKPWRRHKSLEHGGKSVPQAQEEGDESVNAEKDAEREELMFLRKLIKEKPNVFILNNLVMSVQLFAHYEKEINKAREEVRNREAELNEKLLPEKTAMMPNVLQEHFAGKIRFTSYCKSDKEEQTIEPLRPIQIYIVHENIIVTELEDSRYYSSPGKFTVDYTFVLTEADHKGYVRLKKLRNLSPRRGGPSSDDTDLSSIAENQDEIYSEDESVYGISRSRLNGNVKSTTSSMPDLLDEEIYAEEQNSGSTQDLQSRVEALPNGRIPSRTSKLQRNSRFRSSNALNLNYSANSSSSGYTTSYGLDSDSDSSGLSSARILNGRKLGKPGRPGEIPSRCFRCITYMYNGHIYNPRKDQRPLTSQQRRIRDAKIRLNYDVCYVNGYKFAKHFYELFKDQLAEKLDFDDKAVTNAKRSDATIRLEKIDYLSTKNYTSIEQYEVIPCFSSPWPGWARKWLERPRSDWPNSEDLRQLETFACYLIPESLRAVNANAEQNNSLWRLDWNLSFPAAERYLETCLSASQMTVYTIALMLHKIFIRSLGSTFGLDTGHIRNMLFWMVERQPVWSEHDMGKYMLNLLETLHSQIQQRTMIDYFMQYRNLFENVHTDDLLHSQKQLKRIIENPVMFIFHAMEKIYYETEVFPRLDYQELLRLLTINELVLINPNLEGKEGTKEPAKPLPIYRKREVEKNFWNEVKQTNQQYMQTRKRNMSTLINPKQLFDSIIDIKEKCEPLTSTRLSHLLIFFCEHFLKMANSCHKLRASQQMRLYLERTRLLALLLADEPKYQRTSKRILANVQELHDNNAAQPAPMTTEAGAPETPKRNVTDAPLYVSSLKNRFGFPSVIEENGQASHHVVQAEVNVHAAGRSALHGDAIARVIKKLTINDEKPEETNGVETTDF